MPLTDKSYATVAQADEFWTDRNDSEWGDLTNDEKSAALIRATEYIDTSFSWIGEVAEADQVLSWPRDKAYDHEGRLREDTPKELINATAWLAKQATSELDPAQSRGGDIKSVKAGSVEVEWNQFAPTGTDYRHVRRMLKNLITGTKMRKA